MRPVRIAPPPSPASHASGRLADFPPALIEVTLERVIASETFRRSQRHRQFLTHVIRATLDGHRDRLKEVIIGIEVFGRELPTYDPRRDPIVRVEAGRVRDKLARFYESEGADESFEIVLPVGNYAPLFLRRARELASTRGARSRSLAVLPFVNLSGRPEDAAFATGLVDQLTDALGRVPGLRVVARVSASKVRETATDPKAVGRVLAVDHVVEGSLQRSGTRLRCIAYISKTRDGARVWSRRFEHDAVDDGDLFDFQDLIADAVTAGIATPAANDGDGARPTASAVRTVDREARDLFERARYLAQQRTFEGFVKAIALLERAVAVDPGFAQAYSHLGAARASRIAVNTEPTFPAYREVEDAARRALALDPLDGEARSLLATITHRIEYRWKDAEPMFQEALRLSPNSPMVHSAYAWGLVFNGRFDEALRHTGLARELDPLNLGLRSINAAIAMHARRFDAAIREFDAVLDVEPHHLFSRVVMGVALILSGDPEAAMPHLDHIAARVPTHFSARFCQVCVRGLQGRTDEGRAMLDALVDEIGERHYSRVNRAMAETCIGDLDGAFASAEQAAAMRDLLVISIPTHVLFEPLRDDPRYDALIARHGLAAPDVAIPRRPTAR